mmetsp:Transcript_45206/g.98322  ORF Transcript_45206/g.98322 Transcript_45206/m.98322 type:complete len:214 (-) Transcript_45206:711-1352(-)
MPFPAKTCCTRPFLFPPRPAHARASSRQISPQARVFPRQDFCRTRVNMLLCETTASASDDVFTESIARATESASFACFICWPHRLHEYTLTTPPSLPSPHYRPHKSTSPPTLHPLSPFCSRSRSAVFQRRLHQHARRSPLCGMRRPYGSSGAQKGRYLLLPATYLLRRRHCADAAHAAHAGGHCTARRRRRHVRADLCARARAVPVHGRCRSW